MRLTFKKNQRLKSKKWIDMVFSSGHSLKKFPILLLWKEIDPISENQHPIQAAFSAPKRNFKKAVDRNLLKRRMREAYRQGMPVWITSPEPGRYFAFVWLYIGREETSVDVIQRSMKKIMKRWQEEIN